jgi:hypothetical protein
MITGIASYADERISHASRTGLCICTTSEWFADFNQFRNVWIKLPIDILSSAAHSKCLTAYKLIIWCVFFLLLDVNFNSSIQPIITQTWSNLEWPSRSAAAAGLRFSVYIFWKSPVAGAGARCLQHVGYARVQSDIHIPSSIVLYIFGAGFIYFFFFWRLRFNNFMENKLIFTSLFVRSCLKRLASLCPAAVTVL